MSATSIARNKVVYLTLNEVGDKLAELVENVVRGTCHYVFTHAGRPLVRLIPASRFDDPAMDDDAAWESQQHEALLRRLETDAGLRHELKQALTDKSADRFLTLEDLERLVGER